MEEIYTIGTNRRKIIHWYLAYSLWSSGCNHGWKVGGASHVVDTNRRLFPFRPFPISYYCSTHASHISFPTLLLPLNLAKRSGEARASHTAQRKMKVAEVGWDLIHLIPMISKVGRDVSHAYHRAVMPTSGAQERRVLCTFCATLQCYYMERYTVK